MTAPSERERTMEGPIRPFHEDFFIHPNHIAYIVDRSFILGLGGDRSHLLLIIAAPRKLLIARERSLEGRLDYPMEEEDIGKLQLGIGVGHESSIYMGENLEYQLQFLGNRPMQRKGTAPLFRIASIKPLSLRIIDGDINYTQALKDVQEQNTRNNPLTI